ncbi:MAG: NAD-dependent epimerase/dehydratase family protein, partial [Bacteroidales bacterium]|nr:NAD-dependent epimerase/dehydratase family protein [Bacteroidales bacterium]
MEVLVTGSDGLLGTHIVRELLRRDYNVRAFLQPGREVNTLENLPVEKVFGDLLNPEDVNRAADGCDYIIHTAANTSLWPARSEIVRKVNIEGTLNIIQTALQNKVKRLIYVGTANSFGFGTKENPGDETKPFKAKKYGLDYIDSKYEAQQIVLNYVNKNGLNAIILNPTFMVGPYDSKPGSGALILGLYNGKVPGYTKGGRNFLHVKDAAFAICNALDRGEIGECYILGNENLTYGEFNSLVGKQLNIKSPKLFIPKSFILLFGLISQFISLITGKAPNLSYPLARISVDTHFFNPEKARRELGLAQTPVSEAIIEAFEW